MIELLKQMDQELFLLLNGWHSPFFDSIMYALTRRNTWIPLYVVLIFFIIRSFGWRQGGLYVLFLLVSVGLADFLTSGIMKPFFERVRPCQNPELDGLIHVLGGCGGKFGFASSHASNTFALATGMSLLYRKSKWIPYVIMGWAIIVSYSRIYVGAHYPGDILAGAFVGIFLSLAINFILNKSTKQKTL